VYCSQIQEVNAKLAQGQQWRKGRPYEGSKVVAELTQAGDYYIAGGSC
jgi:hypothetical protein